MEEIQRVLGTARAEGKTQVFLAAPGATQRKRSIQRLPQEVTEPSRYINFPNEGSIEGEVQGQAEGAPPEEGPTVPGTGGGARGGRGRDKEADDMGSNVRQGHSGEDGGVVNEARGATEQGEVEGAGGRDRRGRKGVGEVVKLVRSMALHP